MGYKVVLLLTIILEFVFVPIFLKASWPNRTKKSLALKMVCATLYIFAGFCAVKISGNTTIFARLVVYGLVMGWVGDFFLHVSNKPVYFLIGLISFLGGHICYISAYCWAIGNYFPEADFFDPFEVSAFIFLFGIVIAYMVIQKMKLRAALVPILIYTLILIFMVVKASSLGLRLVFESSANALICSMLMSGALLFAASDSILGIMKFNGQSNNRKMKVFNIVTYFSAQILLACTILFVS
ncbi:MAG: lysoplasmalogenase [Eubacteriales bacterium]